MRVRTLLFALWALGGCDDAPVDATMVADDCVQADLIGQCPPGSNPILGATAADLCVDGAELRNMAGHITGQCYGAGQCVVACQFAAACPCGVQSITRDGVVCVPCEEVNPCGDGVCGGGEDPQTCPEDCAGECQPGQMRCQGAAIESCNLRSRWEAIACPAGEVCAQPPGSPPICERDDLVMGGDAGVETDMGPRIAGRIQFGRADAPVISGAARVGNGVGLSALGQFGMRRQCRGNAVQEARCRSAVSLNGRYSLVSGAMNSSTGFVVMASPTPEGEVWLWGADRVVAFGPDGYAPPLGQMPSVAEYCAAYQQACGGGAACDPIPEIVQTSYDEWVRGPAAMRCWIESPGCGGFNSSCLLRERVRGYGEGQSFDGVLDAVHSDDGAYFVFWQDPQTVAVYDVATRTISQVGDLGAYQAPGAGGGGLAISADNSIIAAVGVVENGDSIALAWSRDGGEPIAAVPLSDGRPAEIALSPTGDAIALRMRSAAPLSHPLGIDVINVAEQQMAYRILPVDEPNPPGRACRPAVADGMAFSPDGTLLAVAPGALNGAACAATGDVELWDVTAQARTHVLAGTRLRGGDLTFSPDGRALAIALPEPQGGPIFLLQLSLWDVASGMLIERHTDYTVGSVLGLQYSIDGRFLSIWGAGMGGDAFATLYTATYGPEAP